MRSVFVSLKRVLPHELKEQLANNYKSSKKAMYDFVLEDLEGECGWIYVVNRIPDAEEDDLARVENTLGRPPTCVVVCDFTGRRNCESIIYNFVEKLLRLYEGVVQDDYSDFAWKVSELRDLNKERRFFLQNKMGGDK